MFKNLKSNLKRFSFIGKDEIVVNASEYLALKLKEEVKPLTKAQLTQHQLGSYLPNFDDISTKTDEFKHELAKFCKIASESEHFNWLITSLKQGQVDNLLFLSDRPSEEWVRGTINGIYNVDTVIKNLAAGYIESKGLPKKGKEES